MTIRAWSRRRGIALLLATGLIAAAPGSHSHDDYRELFRDGMRRRDLGNWQEALVFFDAAFERNGNEGERVKLYGRRRFPQYLPRFYVGEALFKIGDYTKALEMWRAYDPGGEFAGVLPDSRRTLIEKYREEFTSVHFPSYFDNLAAEMVMTRASLKSLETRRERVGVSSWLEIEDRVAEKESDEGNCSVAGLGGRLEELSACLELAEQRLALSRASRDFTLAEQARSALEPVIFELIAFQREAAVVNVARSEAIAGGFEAVEEAIHDIQAELGCMREAIAVVEAVLLGNDYAELADEARLALVNGYVKCGELESAHRYVDSDLDSIRRGIVRAPEEAVSSPSQSTSQLYPESHALLVGISEYDNRAAWPVLPGVNRDIAEVEKVLEERGFEVVKTPSRLTRKELEQAIRDFFSNKGRHPNTQILLYYAGHGHAVVSHGNPVSLMVPSDAPGNARDDKASILESSVSMGWLISEIEKLQANHALFVFDSCFAGTIFDKTASAVTVMSSDRSEMSGSSSRGLVSADNDSVKEGSRAMDVYLRSPVRYFLTSGAADQRVPDESVFRKAFVAGLRGYVPNDDDILSAEELALFVEERVIRERGRVQVPGYGPLVLSRRASHGARILFRVPLWNAALQRERTVGYAPAIGLTGFERSAERGPWLVQ